MGVGRCEAVPLRSRDRAAEGEEGNVSLWPMVGRAGRDVGKGRAMRTDVRSELRRRDRAMGVQRTRRIERRETRERRAHEACAARGDRAAGEPRGAR